MRAAVGAVYSNFNIEFIHNLANCSLVIWYTHNMELIEIQSLFKRNIQAKE